ncbi:MAG: SprT family zinc-dependent metalloprotease [Rhodovibrionaceae bacterium]|nr:SprT family zinc-dependent metalloprotease [Rhodovibrionaceae bacterium]
MKPALLAPGAVRSIEIEIDGEPIELDVTVRAQARRMILRVDPADGRVRLTLPPGASLGEARRFLDRHAGWISMQRARLPQRVAFADGSQVPILGREHRIKHLPGRGKHPVWSEFGILWVTGTAEHLPRRVGDFLKARARSEIVRRAHDKARGLPKKPGRITLRDTRSRWGSCSSSGDLNFSWRLVMAPEDVLDYVVAHEVAHLVHLDHSPAFWSLVCQLTDASEDARSWLRVNGARLHSYG